MARRLVGALLLFGLLKSPVIAAEPQAPPLWGYGVKSCDDYSRAWTGTDQGIEGDIAEYRRFRDWMAGLVSGLNLATGSDVLAGADLEGAMRRIHQYCDEHRKDDFFTASMVLIRQVSDLR